MRTYKLVTLFVLLSTLLAACTTPPSPTVAPTSAPAVATKAPDATKPPAPDATKAPEPTLPPTTKFSQSPMLDDLVKSGKLPPVEQRLPANPKVVQHQGKDGAEAKYGGELRVGFTGSSPDWGGYTFIAGWENLVSWKQDFSTWEPNIAEKVDISPDATLYTFHLRKGMKWSDGEPFNTDDMMFYLQGVVQNKDLNPNEVADWLPTSMKTSELKIKQIDDVTFSIQFPLPYGTFLYNLCGWAGRTFALYPKHYLSQFHLAYNPKVDDLVKQLNDPNVTDWKALFYKKGPDNWANPLRWFDTPEYPSLGDWVTIQPLGTGTQIRLSRNPYYWKVDPEGRQLPYIDTSLGISYQDNQARTLAMLAGELDYIKDPGNENRELFYQAMQDGKPIQIKNPASDGANTNTIHFNQTISDTAKAEIFADINFRIGMSYAINRQEIIDVVFSGQGTPAQQAPLNDSAFYVPGMDTQYVEYDVAKANEYLDKVIPDKGADGMRLDKNGKPFNIIFTVKNDLSYGTNWVQITELLIGYWKKVGVSVTLNSQAGQAFDELQKKNKIEASILTAEGGAGITPLIDPRYYVPMDYFGFFGLGWYGWRVPDSTGQTVGVEPPQWAKDARAKYDAAVAKPTYEEQVAAMKEVVQEAKDRFYVIGIARPAPLYYPFSKRLGGTPDFWYDGWNEGCQRILIPEQWFIK